MMSPAIFFHPLPCCSRPWRKRRCSSAVQRPVFSATAERESGESASPWWWFGWAEGLTEGAARGVDAAAGALPGMEMGGRPAVTGRGWEWA